MVVDLAPVVNQVVLPLVASAAAAAVPVVGAWLVYAAQKWFHIKANAQTAQNVDAILMRANDLAQHQLGVVVDAHTSIDVKNEVVANALTYAQPKLIDEMAKLKIDPASLTDRLMARLPLAPDPALITANAAALTAQTPTAPVAIATVVEQAAPAAAQTADPQPE